MRNRLDNHRRPQHQGDAMKIYRLLFALIFFPTTALAVDPQQPVELGKLFFTPTERASLDIIRQNSKAPDRVIAADETGGDETKETIEAEVTPSQPVIVKGYIRRSDGKNTIWVNDRAMSEKGTSKDFAVGNLQKNTGQVPVTVNGQEKKTVMLKPGQIYDPNSGQIYNHAKDVPLSDEAAEEDKNVVDEVVNKLSVGADEIKKRVSDIADLIRPKSAYTTKSDEK